MTEQNKVIHLQEGEVVVSLGISEEIAKEFIREMKESLQDDSEGHLLKVALSEKNQKKLINDLIDQVKES